MSMFTRVLVGLAVVLSPGWAWGQGRFIVSAPKVESSELRSLAQEMHASGALQDVAKSLNEMLILPRDIRMRFEECGEANAYYDSDNHLISMCLELMDDMAQTLEPQFEAEDLDTALTGAFVAVVLHEVGHALVHVLELPITGREEDAVDQLAAWMLIHREQADSVRGAAASYYTEDEENGEDDFADEHSLNRQRYYNLMCWVYGSDPAGNEDLLDEEWGLPEGRASGCEAEYAQLDRSWTRLLRGHVRDGARSLPVANDLPSLPPKPVPAGPYAAGGVLRGGPSR